MKQLILGVILLFPTVGLAQEVRNEKGICYRTIAGLGTYQAPADTATILIQCFDAALAQCALEDTFTDCLEASTGSFMAALEIGRNSFDQSTLQTALPGRRYAWIDFETSFRDLQQMDVPDADAQVAKFRALFFSMMKLNELR